MRPQAGQHHRQDVLVGHHAPVAGIHAHVGSLAEQPPARGAGPRTTPLDGTLHHRGIRKSRHHQVASTRHDPVTYEQSVPVPEERHHGSAVNPSHPPPDGAAGLDAGHAE